MLTRGCVAETDVQGFEKQDVACVVCLCLKISFTVLFSDVKGHVRVGYLFMEVSMDWENKQSERGEQCAGNVLFCFFFLIICAFRDTEI